MTMSKLEMLSPENHAIALVDYQPAMYQGVQSHDRLVTFNNVQVLAKAAKLFGVPTIVTAVAQDTFSGPFMPEVSSLFPGHTVIDRTSMNAWLDAKFREAVYSTGRKKIAVAGLWTEACVMFVGLELLKEGLRSMSRQMPAAMSRPKHISVQWIGLSKPARCPSRRCNMSSSCSRIGRAPRLTKALWTSSERTRPMVSRYGSPNGHWANTLRRPVRRPDANPLAGQLCSSAAARTAGLQIAPKPRALTIPQGARS
jgi:Isochorismatase family